ncbi:threonine ammonia-lyase [Thermoplasmatales archaeon SW_10_69_26]|nr:MAG: threonine ammonia-lyase [Thermoplasmatales archaeon SW_10_69_26]
MGDVEAARQTLADPLQRGVVEHTPTMQSEALSEATGADVHLKLENLQRTGAFKIRGAYNRISALDEASREAGVVCASAGNHAQGVALAARDQGVEAVICMPEDAPISKVQATRELGAEVVLEGRDYNEAYDRAREIEADRGLAFVHPYDDPDVVAGQGTIGLEILEAVPDVDTVLVCVGGGGLLAGIATAIKAQRPDTRVIGVEPTGADALHRSLAAGERVELDAVDTIADGLATRSCGEIAFQVAREHVERVVTVDDDAIAGAILHLLEDEKSLVEGAGAAAGAALLADTLDVEGETLAALVSGGNIDVTLLDNIIDRGLARSGRHLEIEVPLPDRPGTLQKLLDVIAASRANILEIEHNRRRLDVALNVALVRVSLETRGPEHVDELLATLEDAGYDARVLSQSR